ncbi:hypothetical protein SLS53_004546 [Cytospora paraplurivora]|uniref:PRISE-like Rossmann-fold domain-containing protein n=1 Tax=Cytospora paraplurivora TaxID=2898453 RepID=A0AAN9UA44_9PEZI
MASGYPNAKVAFVTGVNGITGNAIVEHLIRQPASEWSKIVITTRRIPDWPLWQDPRIRFIGLDFLKPVEELVEKLRPVAFDVTHAFYASYVHSVDFAKLKEANVPMFKNFLLAIDQSSKSLQRVVHHTGGKHYGVHLGPVEVPLHEGMQRYEDHGENFYYPQEDFLFELSSKRNGMSFGLTVALYFLICKEAGVVPQFPGNKFFYNAVDDQSYAPSIADMSVWASTHEHTKNEAFSHNNGDYIVWKHFWPKLAGYFGLEVPEIPDSAWKAEGDSHKLSSQINMMEWSKDKRAIWERLVAKHGGNPKAFDWGTWDIMDWGLGEGWYAFASVNKARKFGWTRHDDTYDTFVQTFRSFENAGVLPPQQHTYSELKKPTGLRPHPAEAAAAATNGNGA